MYVAKYGTDSCCLPSFFEKGNIGCMCYICSSRHNSGTYSVGPNIRVKGTELKGYQRVILALFQIVSLSSKIRTGT